MVTNKYESSGIMSQHQWVGLRLQQSTIDSSMTSPSQLQAMMKSITPTKNRIQVGFRTPDSSNLKYPYNGRNKNTTESRLKSLKSRRIGKTESFSDVVMQSSLKAIDSIQQGVLYRILFSYGKNQLNISDLTESNDYTVKHFPKTLAALRLRQLDLLVELPSTAKRPASVQDTWTKYSIIYNSRNTLGTLFPGFGKVQSTVSIMNKP